MSGNETKRSEDLGYKIVAELIERQDLVLDELDRLNEKIEALIKSLTGKRDDAETPTQNKAA